MSTVASKRHYTPQEYLELEQRSETKHEYWNGEVLDIVATSGGSFNHGRIAGDIARLIENFLEGKSCECFNSDVRVKVKTQSAYAYPDVSVACAPLDKQMIDGVETLGNPIAIVEVVSPTSESHDRGRKLKEYLQIESLKEYLIVAQNEMRVDQLVRIPEGWRLTICTEPDSVIHLESISFDLRLADIYRRVTLPPPDQEPRI
jgi:Uma2 family endonuclease